MTLEEISVLDLNESPFRIIGKEWMLITAGTKDNFNTMTASWGSFGELWFRPVAFCFVRPQRYTFEFLEKNDYFTLNFFSKEHKKTLELLGSRSGRDSNKIEQSQLTPVHGAHTTWFEQARLVLECRKLYFQDLAPENLLDPKIDSQCYPQKDYHRMYIGEVLRAMTTKATAD